MSTTLTPTAGSRAVGGKSKKVAAKRNQNIVSTADMHKIAISRFFRKKVNLNKMLPIILDKAKMSLRVLDYFVTNYVKKHKVAYLVNDRFFSVYMEYKAQLKRYSKEGFDPFRRGNKVSFNYGEGKITTTFGQLHFFMWAIENNILDYVIDHLDEIEDDMNTHNNREGKRRRSSRKTKVGGDKSETSEDSSLSKSKEIVPLGDGKSTELEIDNGEVGIKAQKLMTKYHVKINVKFD